MNNVLAEFSYMIICFFADAAFSGMFFIVAYIRFYHILYVSMGLTLNNKVVTQLHRNIRVNPQIPVLWPFFDSAYIRWIILAGAPDSFYSVCLYRNKWTMHYVVALSHIVFKGRHWG